MMMVGGRGMGGVLGGVDDNLFQTGRMKSLTAHLQTIKYEPSNMNQALSSQSWRMLGGYE